MEITQFSSCEKSTTASIKIQHQGDDDCVFDLDGIVRAEFVPRNTKVNSEYYNGLLDCLKKKQVALIMLIIALQFNASTSFNM